VLGPTLIAISIWVVLNLAFVGWRLWINKNAPRRTHMWDAAGGS